MKKMYPMTMLIAAVIFAACSNDNDPKTPDPEPEPTYVEPGTQSDFSDIRESALEDLKRVETFDVSEGITFTTDNGVTFTWNGTLYDSEWVPVTGEVTLEYIEIFDRGNMAAANKPLMGRDAEDNLRPLITGGEFYVNMTQDGNQLQTYNTYHITVPGDLTGGVDPNMILWEGTIDDNGDLFWDQFSNWDGQREKEGGLNTEGNDYNLWCSHFCWTNIDILAGEDGEKTPIFVKPPHGWNNKNSCVYVAYKGKAGSLAFLDQYKTEEGYFTEHYGWAPIGFEFYVIFTAESEGKYVYWIGDIKVEKEKVIEVPLEELDTCTKEEFIKMVNELP